VSPHKLLAQEIRKLAREKLRASKALWREYKRTRPSVLDRIRKRLGLIGLSYGAVILLALARHSGPKAPLLLLALYSAATVVGRSNALFNTLYRSGDLAFYMHVPVTDKHFFGYAWRNSLKSSLWVWFYSFLAFGYLTVISKLGPIGWTAAVIASTLQWLLIVSLVVVVELLPPSWPKTKIGLSLYLLTFGAIFLPEVWVTLAWRALLPLPTAWIPHIFERGVLNHESGSLYLLIPILLFLVSLPLTSRRLRERYPIVEPTYPLASNAVADVERDDDEIGLVREEDRQSRSTEATSNLRVTPEPLRGLDWNSSGWIEGLAGHLLNEREKKSADFLCGGHLGLWSDLWRIGLKVAATGVVALLLPKLFAPWIGIAIGAISSSFALPVIGGRWEGMQLVTLSGTVRPACAGIPLSYTEMSRVLAKINLLRYAAWLPIFLVYGALLAWRLQMAPLLGIKVAAEVLLVLISFQPILIVGHHSYGTNDTKRLNLHSIVAILVIGSIGIAYAVCLTIVFIAMEWAPEGSRVVPAVVAATGMFFCSLLIWFCYRLFYNRGRLDTMRVAD
jgi:hypothetical protein